MGIDIHAIWKDQTKAEEMAQIEHWMCPLYGYLGYLREAYHGTPYATQYLCSEVFENENGNDALIPAAVLRARLPKTLELVEERERTLYQSDDKWIEKIKQSFRDFVALCEAKEKETGETVLISADY